MTTFAQSVAAGHMNTAEALALFDSLDTVDTDLLLGDWQGAGFPTGHPLDGVLEAYHWHGKRFDSLDAAHPLVFTGISGRTASVNPALLPVGLLNRMPPLKTAAAGRLFQLCMPLFATRRSRARLRMTRYRGRVSATMIYDDAPIHDVFRKVDDDALLGVMDLKGMRQPFFFVLRRKHNGV